MPTISSKPSRKVVAQKRDWAHEVDINKPMSQARFKQLVPDMAHTVSHFLTYIIIYTNIISVSLRAGHFSEGSCIPSGARRFGLCSGPYIGGKDCSSRICHRSGCEAYDKVSVPAPSIQKPHYCLEPYTHLPSKLCPTKNSAILKPLSLLPRSVSSLAMFKSTQKQTV
jgi:hypothetical protein